MNNNPVIKCLIGIKVDNKEKNFNDFRIICTFNLGQNIIKEKVFSFGLSKYINISK